jgi:hypothetical protein
MLDRRTHTASPAPRAGGGLPRIPLAVLPYAAILAAACAARAAGAIPREWMLALAGSALAAGAGAGVWTWVQRVSLCDRADRFIATGDGEPPPQAVLDERRATLVADHDRRDMARSLRNLIDSAREPGRTLVRVPVDRPGVLADADLIEELAERIERPGTRVPARGMALVHVLLTDAASPIYGDADAGEGGLHRALVRIELELGAQGPPAPAGV